MNHVQASNVTKTYDDVVAVEGIYSMVRDGVFLVVVGPSGCGKSTTLRIVARLETVSDSEIRIGSEVVNDVRPQDRDIAMVFQNHALYPHMTVRENMSFGLRLSGEYDDGEIDDRIEDAAELLKISELMYQYPKQLSGGQQQRVALGRSIVRDPDVFLMDELLSNFDANLRSQMRTEIQRPHEELEVTIIYVTHDQTEAMTMGDRIAILNDGELQQIAEPEFCYSEPKNRFVAGFMNSPSMIFLEVNVEPLSKGVSVTGDRFEAELGVSVLSGRYTLGIRPDDQYAADGFGRILADVDVVEPMRADNYLYLNPPMDGDVKTEFIARVDSEFRPVPGERITLDFDAADVHFFDETGDRVTSEPTADRTTT